MRDGMVADLSSAVEEPPIKDKAYRRYATGIDRALGLFETNLQEWADYISFLNRLLRVWEHEPAIRDKRAGG